MKKIISILLAAVLLLIPCSAAFAIGAEIYGNDIAGKAGEAIIVPVCIKNNPGVMGIGINISYDNTVLTPVSVTSGTVTSGGMINDSIGTADKSKVKVVWTDSGQTKEDGTIFVITFETTEKVTQTSLKLSLSQGDTFNEKYEDVEIECKDIEIFFDGSVAGVETTTAAEKSEPDNKDIITAVDMALNHNGYDSITDVSDDSEEFAEEADDNLRDIAGTGFDNGTDVSSVISDYKEAVKNQWVSDTLASVDADMVDSIISEALESVGAESIDKVTDDKKQDFASDVAARITSQAGDIENIADKIGTDAAFEAISELLPKAEESMTEGKAVENTTVSQTEENGNLNWIWILTAVIAAAAIITAAVIIILKKRKGNNEENND